MIEDIGDYPTNLRERWALRDELYRRRHPFMSSEEVAAIREWRAAEATDLDDYALVAEARAWEKPK